jgi:hypothetical protein
MAKNSNSVYVLQHSYELWGNEDTKMIGVYATWRDAELAMNRIMHQPGFIDWPTGFSIEEHELGKDNWCEGFITSINITVPSKDGTSLYTVASAWRPGNQYRILMFDQGVSPQDALFSIGDEVLCKEFVNEMGEHVRLAYKLVSDCD